MPKKRSVPKKVPAVMKPKISLKVAQAVDSKATSYSEASLGRSDWEWKPEEDASSAADSDLSSGSETSACSKDANTSSSSLSASLIQGRKFSPKRRR